MRAARSSSESGWEGREGDENAERPHPKIEGEEWMGRFGSGRAASPISADRTIEPLRGNHLAIEKLKGVGSNKNPE